MSSEPFIHPPFKIGWHHFVFTLPSQWEITSYSTKVEKGKMSFADEHGALGQILWRQVKATPDLPRIMNEIHRLYIKSFDEKAANEFKELKFEESGQVLMGWEKKGERFYGSSYVEEHKLLVEWIFPDYSRRKAKPVLEMFKSFRPNTPDENGNKFYGAFGLELHLPEEFEIETVYAIPAAVSIEFLNHKKHRIMAHRWGLPELLLQGEAVDEFYHRYLYKECRYVIREYENKDFFGSPGALFDFKTRGRLGFDFLLGPWWTGVGSIFHDKEEMRMYAIEHIAPGRFKDRLKAGKVFREGGTK